MTGPLDRLQNGTRLIGLHLPDAPGDGLALELRRDCPGPGEWVVRLAPADGSPEQVFLFVAEAPAWLCYWEREAELYAARPGADAAQQAGHARQQAAIWRRNCAAHYQREAALCGGSCSAPASCPDRPALDGRLSADHPAQPTTTPNKETAMPSYKDVEDFRCKIAELAQREKLNLGRDWRAITAALADNGYCCTCQPGAVPCPCVSGLSSARAGQECHCGLFVGHNLED